MSDVGLFDICGEGWREVHEVLDLIRQLKSQGIGEILISHRLNNVLAVTDRTVVLRQRRAVADLATKETKMPDIVSAIVGGGDIAAAAAQEEQGVNRMVKLGLHTFAVTTICNVPGVVVDKYLASWHDVAAQSGVTFV